MEQARIIALPTGFGPRVEVLEATYQSHTFTRHTHDTYTLGVVLAGGGTLWCRGAQHFASRGSVVVIPPGEVHTGSVWPGAGVLSYVAIYVPAELMVRHAQSLGLPGDRPPEFGSVVFRDAVVCRAFAAICGVIGSPAAPSDGDTAESGARSHASDEAAAEEALSTAITEVLSRHAERSVTDEGAGTAREGSPEPRVVKVVRDVIEDCYADAKQTSLRVLAERAGVSPFRVIRAFRDVMGLSPHHYLIQVRVERARRLLAEGIVPSMTALETGFTDQSHLTHHFRKYVGITPAKYQRGVCGS
jgi:AraC-like DNA-binding protein/mannose-6-phosphate isomerase-like protein (cupin superfamily)